VPNADVAPSIVQNRWTAEQVQALAPDAGSLSSARGLSSPGKWQLSGAGDGPPASLWGLCKGSGANPYQTIVDLDEPAYKCSCPSRKFPCKHALGLLLMWAAGSVAGADPPQWVTEWHEGRAAKAEKAQAKRDTAAAPPTEAQQKEAARRAARRDDRVAQGVAELAQWLDDQVRQGIAGLDKAGYRHFDTVAKRLVDAQAPGLAREVKALAGVVSSGEGWDHRLLTELAGLRLLTRAFERVGDLPAPLAETVRSRVGFNHPTEKVLATPAVRDTWQVIGVRDEVEEKLTTRRVWLLGRETGQFAVSLSFAVPNVPGQALAVDLVVGTQLDADLHYYPGVAPMRAAVGTRHSGVRRCTELAPATTIAAALDAYADAVAADPWTTIRPVLLRGVLAPGKRWHVVDDDDALPLDPVAGSPWHLVATAAGRPTAIAGEWGPAGFRPLALHATTEVIAA
jgi:SWIM zinc finger